MASSQRILVEQQQPGIRQVRKEYQWLVRIYVWDWPLRLIHWTIFLAVAVLALTGYYIHDPFIISRTETPRLMTTVRFVHEVTGFIFALAVVSRLIWFFIGNRYARLSAFVPTTRRQVRGIGQMLRYYLFLRWFPPPAVGHNALAGITYIGVYVLLAVEALTGFALYARVGNVEPWATLFGWMNALFTPQTIRITHHLVMWLIIAFVVHHVYSAFLVSAEEKTGVIGSIFTGYKFIPESWLRDEEANEGRPTRPFLGRVFGRRRARGSAEAGAEPAAPTTERKE